MGILQEETRRILGYFCKGLGGVGDLDEVFDDSDERIGLLPREAVAGIGDGNHAATRDAGD